MYGVIVGLSIKEALSRGIPPLLGQDVLPVGTTLGTEALRVALFVLMIVRFYLGASVYFGEIVSPKVKETPPDNETQVGLDFLVGLLHFLIFAAWSMTIVDPSTTFQGMSFFLGGLFIILLYDLAWFLAKKILGHPTGRMKIWTIANFGTAVAVLLIFLLSRSEAWAFLPVAFVSVIDLAEIVSGEPYIKRALQSLFS